MSDNQPQVGTLCGSRFTDVFLGTLHVCQHPKGHDGACEDAEMLWKPDGLPQPTPAEPRIDWNPEVEEYRKLLMERYSDRCSMEQIAGAAYILAGAEPRIETVPDEREAQAEAVNKIWNQFRSGDGEEDCELYRALEQAFDAGRMSLPEQLRAEFEALSGLVEEEGGLAVDKFKRAAPKLHAYWWKFNEPIGTERMGILLAAGYAASLASPPSSPGATVPQCRVCGGPSPWGDPCEKCEQNAADLWRYVWNSIATRLASSPGAPQEQK